MDLLRQPGHSRKHEVVWHILEEPFVNDEIPKYSLTHWPGIIQERRVNTETAIRDDIDDRTGAPEIAFRQRAGYIVLLLATRTTVFSPYDRTVPYAAYAPQELQNTDVQGRLRKYTKVPDLPNLHDWSRAITPWTCALQMATYLRDRWSLLDPYYNSRLQEKLDRFHEKASTARAKEMVLEELKKHETSFQAIYWGCEKIWVGEMVRLTASWGVGDDGKAVLKVPQQPDIPLGDTALAGGMEDRQVLFKIGAIVREPKAKDVFLYGRFMHVQELTQEEQRQRAETAAIRQLVGPVEQLIFDEQYLPTIANGSREYQPVPRFHDPDGEYDDKISVALLAG